MTFSYSIAESSDRDRVRGKIGDTVEATYQIDDETIDSILVDYPSVLAASVESLNRIIAKRSRDFDRSSLGLSSSRGSVLSQLRELRDELKDELRSGGGGLFVGGASISANDAQAADTDFKAPDFTVGAGDYPGT